MEILNQSTLVHKPNYFHLAYLSASTRTTKFITHSIFSISAIGLSSLIIGGILIIISQRINKYLISKGMMKNKFMYKKARAILLTLGLMLILSGIFIVPKNVKRVTEEKYNHPDLVTELNIDHIHRMITSHLDADEPIPDNMTALSKQWQIDKRNVQDGWFHTMRLQKLTTDEITQYILISAGEDGIFDTEDDMRSEPIYTNKEKTSEMTNAAQSF